MLHMFGVLCTYDLNFQSHKIFPFDIFNNQFHCIFSNQSIPYRGYNDNVCDCCDCSDEYENPFVSSPNTCPIDVDKFSPDLYKMFNESIILSKENLKKSDSLSNEIKSIKVNADSEILFWQNKYQSSKYMHQFYKNKLSNITKTFLNITELPENTIIDTVMKIMKLLNPNKTTTTSFDNTTSTIPSLRNQTKEVIEKAFEMKNYTLIKELAELLENKRKYSIESKKYIKEVVTAKDNKQKMETLISQNVGMRDEWRHYLTGTLTWKLPGLEETLIIENLRTIKIIKYGTVNQYSKPVKIKDLFIFNDAKGNRIILKPICTSSLALLRHYSLSSSKRLFVFGTPVVCPTEYSEKSFVDFIREIQYFI